MDKSAELINLLSGNNFNSTTYLEPVKFNFKEKEQDKDKEKEEKRRKDYGEKDYDESVVTYCNSSDDLQAKQSDDDDLKKYIKMVNYFFCKNFFHLFI